MALQESGPLLTHITVPKIVPTLVKNPSKNLTIGTGKSCLPPVPKSMQIQRDHNWSQRLLSSEQTAVNRRVVGSSPT